MKGYEVYTDIHKLKNRGYGKRRTARELEISRDTVEKYWNMNEDEYACCLLESKTRTNSKREEARDYEDGSKPGVS